MWKTLYLRRSGRRSKSVLWILIGRRRGLLNRCGESLDFDRSYMYKIQTGRLATPKIIQAICEILDLPEQGQDTTIKE